MSERSRIARDLHAEVVPAVRRALAEAERDGSVERLAASLRDVLHEVDALVGSEHAIQLEFGGLVPALEWLAERVEERSEVRVMIHVDDGAGGRPGDPPMEVAAAAFRVAGLALENVIRHAPGCQATVEVQVAGDRVHLAIADDGPGLPTDVERTAAGAGHRGLADMVAEASGCGASLVSAAGAGPPIGRARPSPSTGPPRRSGPLGENPQPSYGRGPDSRHRPAPVMLGRLTHPGRCRLSRRLAHR